MRSSTRILLTVSLWAGWNASFGAARADTAWVDDIWRDHLLHRSAQVEATDPVLAEAFLREAVRMDPLWDDALTRLAGYYHRRGEDALAVAVSDYMRTQELAGAAPEWDADAKRAELADRPFRPESDEAQVEYEGAIERATRAAEQDDFMRAEQALRALLRTYPRDPQILLDLGHCYAVSQDWPMFTALYAYYHRWYPNTFDIFNNLCVGLEQLGRPDRAFELIVGRLEESDVVHHAYLLGNAVRLARVIGRTDEAERWAGRWLEIAPEDAAPRVALARIFLERGDVKAAQNQLGRAWALEPQRADVCYLFAELHAREGRPGDALRWLDRLEQRSEREGFLQVLEMEPFASLEGIDALKTGEPSP